MKLKTGNPRVRGPRKQDRVRGARSSRGSANGAEPATFAWVEPLGDSRPVVVEREVVVEHAIEREVIVEKPVVVEKEIQVERPVYIDREVEVIVEKPIEVTKEVIVEKEVVVEKEVPVEVTREVIVEKEVPVEKTVYVEKQVFVEKPVEVTKEVIVEKFVDSKEGVKATKSEARAESKDKKSKKQAKEPKAIVVGRGPTVWNKISRVMPAPKPVLAGAMTLLLAIASLALISPSSDNATAGRSTPKAPSASNKVAAPPQIEKVESEGTKGESRNPFAADGYEEELEKKAAAEKKAKKDAAKKKAEAAKTKAAAPASAATSLYTADLTTYSSYTPWKKATKRAGGWIDFGGKPTVKVLSVGKTSILLFVVTDVEVIEDKSKGIKYDNPIRQIKVAKGGTVRFADYRDIQGDDVTYTIRFDGSERIKLADAKN